jgi:hypothetical protein
MSASPEKLRARLAHPRLFEEVLFDHELRINKRVIMFDGCGFTTAANGGLRVPPHLLAAHLKDKSDCPDWALDQVSQASPPASSEGSSTSTSTSREHRPRPPRKTKRRLSR